MALRLLWLGWLLAMFCAAQPVAEAMKLAAGGDYAGAETLLAAAIRASPSDAELRYRLGAVQLRLKKPAEAVVHLEAAARLSPAIPAVWLALAHARLENGKLAEAKAAAAEGRKLAADNPNFDRALAAFLHQLATALRAAKDPARAVEAWQDAIALDPGHPEWFAALANLFLDHRTPEPAIAVLENAAGRFPADTNLLRLLGLAHYSAGATSKAIDLFLRIMDLAPRDEQSYIPIETLLHEAGERLPAILEKLRAFAAAEPSGPVGHFLLAQALAVQNPASAEIEPLLRKAIEVEPKFWPAHYELHKPLLARQRTRDAAQTLQRAVELNPRYAPARYALAQVYAKLGDRGRAAEQRRAHHQLLTLEREAAQARQEAMPQLPYQLRTR
jgi:predicted Zn-dependent protease